MVKGSNLEGDPHAGLARRAHQGRGRRRRDLRRRGRRGLRFPGIACPHTTPSPACASCSSCSPRPASRSRSWSGSFRRARSSHRAGSVFLVAQGHRHARRHRTAARPHGRACSTGSRSSTSAAGRKCSRIRRAARARLRGGEDRGALGRARRRRCASSSRRSCRAKGWRPGPEPQAEVDPRVAFCLTRSAPASGTKGSRRTVSPISARSRTMISSSSSTT